MYGKIFKMDICLKNAEEQNINFYFQLNWLIILVLMFIAIGDINVLQHPPHLLCNIECILISLL